MIEFIIQLHIIYAFVLNGKQLAVIVFNIKYTKQFQQVKKSFAIVSQ